MRRVVPFELSGDEIEYFLVAARTDDHCGGVGRLIDDIDSGKMQLWVWNDDSSTCIFITEITVHRDGSREFLLRMFAGKNMIQKYKEAADDLCIQARKFGCERWIAYVKPELLEKFMASGKKQNSGFDFKEIYRVISREV